MVQSQSEMPPKLLKVGAKSKRSFIYVNGERTSAAKMIVRFPRLRDYLSEGKKLAESTLRRRLAKLYFSGKLPIDSITHNDMRYTVMRNITL